MCRLETRGPSALHPSRPQHSGRGSGDSFLATRTLGKTLPGPHPARRRQREGQTSTLVRGWTPEAQPGGRGRGSLGTAWAADRPFLRRSCNLPPSHRVLKIPSCGALGKLTYLSLSFPLLKLAFLAGCSGNLRAGNCAAQQFSAPKMSLHSQTVREGRPLAAPGRSIQAQALPGTRGGRPAMGAGGSRLRTPVPAKAACS